MKGRKGFTLVELMIVLAIIAIIAAFAIPNLMKSRMSANEAGAIGALRTLVTAQATYMNRYNVYGSLYTLRKAELIESPIAKGQKQGYYIGQITTGSDFGYCFGCVPMDDGRSGDKEYVTTQAGTVYEALLDTTSTMATNASLKDSSNVDAWWAISSECPTEYTTEPEDDTTNWTPIGG